MNALRRLPVFFVICLLVLLPVSVAAQIAASTSQSYFPSQQEQKASDLAPESDFSAQAVCVWPNMDCAGGCWTPCSTGTWYCGSTKAVCCSSSAKFCADKCWTQCSSDYIWVCTDSGAVCKLKSECTDPKYFIPCGGGCWSGCGSGYRFECVSGAGQCKRESCTDPSYPYWCGNNCWSGCGAGYDFVCNNGKGECKSQCKDNDGDGYGNPGLSSCSKGSATDCNDNNANVNPGMAEVCSDGVDNDCDGKADGADTDCCPGTHPNYCLKNNLCWKESWMCENSIKCSSTWQVCSSSSETAYCDNSQLKCCPSDRPYYINGQCEKCMGDFPVECGGKCWTSCSSGSVFNCNGGNPKCCPGDFPVYCQRTDSGGKDACWKSQSECDTAQKCGSEGWTVCREPSFPYWNCRSDGVSKCCPTGYPYMWNSDYLCHTTPEQVVTCTVPDGLSSQCDCNSNSDCPADKPYCEENYPAPISDGYDACIASEPEYCGNGKCVGSETFSSCVSDCGQLAPKGTISVDVYYSSGANANKPISGAYVSIDGVQKGTTDNSGKKSFEASYGSRNVKVECPDGAFCAEKTVGVDGIEYVGFGCGCNPSTDSDGDGYSNEDEGLLGTDPNDAKENYASVFSGFEHPKSCLDIPALIGLVWNNKDNLIQANDIAIAALNTTAVMAADFSASSSAAIVALSVQEVLANADVVPIEATLMESLEASEAVGGFFTDNGAILVMTDYNTSTTAIIAISATCVGWGVGGIYGAGTGVKDDVVGIWELLQGLWYAATHITEIPKIVGDVVGLIKSIPDIFGKAGEIFHDAMMGVLQKGSGVTQKTGLFKSDRQAYLQFQLGFLNGFVTGYVLEQIAATFVGAGAILKGVKSAGFAGKAGKTLKLSKLLTEITQKYGGEVASAVKNLKYADRIVDWAEAEREALVRLVKLKHEKWLGELSEAEARAAAKNIGKLADADISNLLKTKLGQRTLKAADATDDLLAKQAKLVGKWGVSKADEVVSKCFFFVCYGNRIDDLNKILKAMPDGIVDSFSHEKAVKFLGDKKLVEAANDIIKGVDNAAVSRVVSDIGGYEKLLEYTKAVKKLDPTIVNPLGDIGKHQLLMVIKNPSVATRVGEQTIDGIAVLKKGDIVEKWGWDHIKARNHHNQIQEALGLSDNDIAVKKVINEVIETPDNIKHIQGDKFEFSKTVTRGQKSHNILVVVSDRVGDIKINKGSIQTANPID